MADGKNSFLLYKDVETTIAKLSDEEAGKLFKHLLAYVNDKEPVLDDRLLEIVFEPIKQSLKRDLKKRDGIKKKRAEAGKLGGQAKVANASKGKQKLANVAVSDSVSVSVSVSDSVINNKRKTTFSPPTLEEVKEYFTSKLYTEESGERAYEYYNVAGRIDAQGKQVKNRKQKMNSVWFKEENKKKEITMEQWRDLRDKMGIRLFTEKYGNEQAQKIMLYFL